MDSATGLPLKDLANVQSLIDVGEWLVAFETLCTQVYEWEISLSSGAIRDLEVLGSALAPTGLTDYLWEDATEGQLMLGGAPPAVGSAASDERDERLGPGSDGLLAWPVSRRQRRRRCRRGNSFDGGVGCLVRWRSVRWSLRNAPDRVDLVGWPREYLEVDGSG
ncbi:MafI family immunity protein [Kribbella jejuensis]